ncbi:Dyp-type peroxidase [Tsukamurella ocularis]|uniref:Dyp-type peroxidase n=1 Tax=Tsukamurella ocularis TaxID=1970234 RepID=UPI002167D8FA|nr:Dyp-type peroxidase [Tsukamurella ocularis]MCS3781717.1 deferrochelatase/peroxidase EfeB [Tsukamurella ocularis]MCS3788211.1 deferrochelatase/peroxidase EfeB [Tsukamurella ocularis]MCS3851931.1 deferrochelatase/peroxidase EfeB [Tsukamurella ocularis]
MKASRRGFLAGAAAAGAVAGAAACSRSAAPSTPAAVPEQRHASYAAFDVTCGSVQETDDLLRTLTERIRALKQPHTPVATAITAPPTDSGTLGPELDGGADLTVNIGYGASFFDRWHPDRRPTGIRPMREFDDDRLDPTRCHGDLLLEIRAADQDTVLHALRDLSRAGRGGLAPRWRQDGTQPAPRPDGAPRNHFGFKDGTSNVRPEEFDRLVWLDDPAQPWTRGGTFLVVRLIRMLTEFWDRISLAEQENIFGRDRASGAPLDGSAETDVPQYADDPGGDVIPLTSHIRLANPRTAETDGSRIFRRAYNYAGGLDMNGNLDLGLVFTCLQRDVVAQFEAVQERLSGEPLTDYIAPFGGGYFYLPPRDAGTDCSTTGGLL